jgi:predicted nucleic acid-binding protein
MQCLRSGTLLALRSGATDAELPGVLARPQLSRRSTPAAREAALASWQRLARAGQVLQPAPWRCRDPDDQKFLDLAHSNGAGILFTKDRALLALARKAQPAGLRIAPPRGFAFATAATERGAPFQAPATAPITA